MIDRDLEVPGAVDLTAARREGASWSKEGAPISCHSGPVRLRRPSASQFLFPFARSCP
jgi:hypothetical protein